MTTSIIKKETLVCLSDERRRIQCWYFNKKLELSEHQNV